MIAPEFLDTNILVYAYDASEPSKQQIAQDLVRRALAGEIAASSQVLAEFAATLLHKVTPAAKPEDLIALLDTLGPIKLVPVDGDIIHRAVQARGHDGLHFLDGIIVAKADICRYHLNWLETLDISLKSIKYSVIKLISI